MAIPTPVSLQQLLAMAEEAQTKPATGDGDGSHRSNGPVYHSGLAPVTDASRQPWGVSNDLCRLHFMFLVATHERVMLKLNEAESLARMTPWHLAQLCLSIRCGGVLLWVL